MTDNLSELVIKDDLGRDIKTIHLTPMGTLDYTNDFSYEGNSKQPTKETQIYFRLDDTTDHRHPIRVITNQLNKDHLVMTRDAWYDKDGSLAFVSDYNLDGKKIKEKNFYKNQNGLTCYHRKHFDPKTGKETLNQDVARFSFGDIVITPEVQQILDKYPLHCTNEQTSKKEAPAPQKRPSLRKAIEQEIQKTAEKKPAKLPLKIKRTDFTY